ncbi:tail fiber/spike domain-containing protein [Citrobacter sp. MAL-2]|nr:hypothetical protein [Citrobacter amalonaticus]
MTTYNTGNPLGSAAAKDLYDNAQNFDFALNDITQAIWNDRFGRERNTWFGLETMVINAAGSYGYVILNDMSFQDGGTVNLNELLLDESTGEYFKWTGTFPVGGKVVPPGSIPASTGGEGPGAWLSVGDSTLRTMLASSSGAGMVGYDSGETYAPGTVGEAIGPYTATGGDRKLSREDRAKITYIAPDFEPFSTNAGAAVNAAIAQLRTEEDAVNAPNLKGGKIILPRGRMNSVTPISINRILGQTGIDIQGQGQTTTSIDLTSAPAGSDGIESNSTGAVYGEFSNFCITGARRRAFSFESGSRLTFKNVQAYLSEGDGFFFGNNFVTSLEKCTSGNNSGSGFNFSNTPPAGEVTSEKTSINLVNCFASNNASTGYILGNMNYSSVRACAADFNGLYGYLISGMTFGLSVEGSGSENNGRSGFAVIATRATDNIRGVTLKNITGYRNNLANSGHPTLLFVQAANGGTARCRLEGAVSNAAGPGAAVPDVIVEGSGARLILKGDCDLPKGWRSRNGGYVDYEPVTHVINRLVNASTPTGICNLKSTQGFNTTYSGEITVVVSNGHPSVEARNISIYKLLIVKSVGTQQLVELSKAGHVAASGNGASLPSFTWSLDSANNALVATPNGGVGGIEFWFEITTSSQIVAFGVY